MTVRQSLLAILDQGPCYGYQLRSEYSRRAGAVVNVGQVYTTLERLERDGLVDRRGADERGHVYWGITDAGRAEAGAWFATPDPRSARDELAHKLALAATLPGVDVGAVVDVQRRAARDRLDEVEPAGEGAAAAILHAAALANARAELEWLDAVATLVAGSPEERVLPLSVERPRRGRPARDPQA